MFEFLLILFVAACALGYFILKTVIMVIIAIYRHFYPPTRNMTLEEKIQWENKQYREKQARKMCRRNQVHLKADGTPYRCYPVY